MREGARSEVSVIVSGTSRGAGPRRPAMAVARSCVKAPITSPVLDSFIDAMRLGSTV